MPYFKNDTTNVLVIHIPKTGGTSLESYFSQKFNIPLNVTSLYMFIDDSIPNVKLNSSMQHMTYKTICKYKCELGVDLDNATLITIVRNPYERLVSDLFFNSMITKDSTKEEVVDIIKSYMVSECLDNHNIPQHCFITDDNNEILPNIHILRTETLNEDMHKLGYSDFNVRENVNANNVNYYDYLNNESIELINEFYERDFQLFGYVKTE